MKIFGMSEEEISFCLPPNTCVRDIKRLSSNCIQVSIRTELSREKYGSISCHLGKERRTIGVCWHGHYEFYANIFEKNPKARIKTAHADYRGLNELNKKCLAVKYALDRAGRVCDCFYFDFRGNKE